MSRNGSINSALHRSLNGSGNSYDKYLPSSKCKSTYLGTGDTFFSMDGIKDNILKNYSQTKELAPKLKKQSLPGTVASVYDFLYNNIQYKADASDQNLRSPACSWAVRKDGIDCKSYSIFAGCLLLNMGLKFYVRKIKQPTMAPEEYTHVYIVVPKNQDSGSLNGGYHVIDATKHSNTEAVFTQKNDVYMSLPHYGLQAPATRRRKRGLNGADVSEPMAAFCTFTTLLKQSGVKPSIVSELNNHIRKEVHNGYDPDIKISKQGLIVDRTLYHFLDKNDQYAIIPDFIVKTQSNWGLNGEKSGFDFSQVMDAAKGELDNNSGGWLESIFSKIKDFISCMGSTATPKTVRDWRKNQINPRFSTKINQIGFFRDPQIIIAAVNGYYKDVAIIKAHQTLHIAGSKKRCGKDANRSMVSYIEEIGKLMDRAIVKARVDYDIVLGTETITASANSIPGLADNWKGQSPSATYTVIKSLKLKPGKVGGGIQIDPLPSGGGGTSTGGGASTGGGGTIKTGGGTTTGGGSSNNLLVKDPNPPRTFNPVSTSTVKLQKASMSPVIIIGLVLGGLYMANQSKDKTKK